MSVLHRLQPPALGDIVAGVSVALVLVPQSMAYAELAGLPPYVGLFAGALPPLLAAPFTSSPYLQTGPVALTSLLTLGALEGRAELASVDYVKLAALLALIVGATRMILGIARLGIVAYLMSEPVLIGFTSAAAVLIVSSQLPTIFGVIPETDGVIQRAWWTLIHPGEWQGSALVFAAVTLVLMLGGRRLHQLFPGVLIAVIATAVASSLSDYTGATLGDLPGGFIEINLDLPWGSFGSLLLAGIVIALVGYAEPASISRTFAAADRIPWSSNRELISQGVANLASGVSGGFPVGGSFSRSSLNRFAGASSVWSGAITGAVVLAFLPFSPILEPLPRAVLGAIVFGAVFKLIQLPPIVGLWRISIPQATVATGTFVATLATAPSVERGVLIGLGLSIVMHLLRELAVHADYEVNADLITIRPRGIVWFASAPRLEEVITGALEEYPDIDRVCLDLRGVGRVDYTGAMVMKRFIQDNARGGIETHIINVAPEAQTMLEMTLGDTTALFSPPDT